MATKSAVQTFTSYWNKLRMWATEQKIPNTALIPVFNMDLQRLKQGDPMSESERYRAVMASAGLNYSTSLPTDVRKPSNVIQNVRDTLWNIFTGLNPVGLVRNAVDTVENTIEHPMTTLKILADTHKAVSKFAEKATSSILEFVPGAIDAARVANKGIGGGLSTLASHPISSILDVFTLGRIGGFTASVLGKDVNDIAAARLGIPKEELGTDSFWRNLGKIAGTAKNPLSKEAALNIGEDEEGNTILSMTPETISQTMHRWGRKMGVGKTAGDLMYGALSTRENYTSVAKDTLQEFHEAMDPLTDDQRKQAVTLITKSGRPFETLINDGNITLNVRQAIAAAQPVTEWLKEQGIASGYITPVRMPDGTTEIYTLKTADKFRPYSDKVNKSQQAFYERKAEADIVTKASDLLDTHNQQILGTLKSVKQAVWSNITGQVPQDSSDVTAGIENAANDYDTDINTFNHEKIKRKVSVRESPERAKKLQELGLPVEHAETGRLYSHIDRIKQSHANVLNAVFKPGGLIDQLDGAFQSKDWESFRSLSLQAKRYMDRHFARELHLPASPEAFDAIRAHLDELYQNAKDRKLAQDKFNDLWNGITKKGKKNSVATLYKNYQKAMKDYSDYVTKHPPDGYQPLYLDILTKKLIEHEGTEAVTNALKRTLVEKGADEADIAKLGSTPRALMELTSAFSNSVYKDPIVGETFPGIMEEVQASAYKEIATLRAQGFIPHYVPNVNIHDIPQGGFDTYDIYINTSKVPTVDAANRRTWAYGTSVNNFMAAMTKGVKDQLARDGTLEYLKNYVLPKTHQYKDIEQLILNYKPFRDQLIGQLDENSRGAVIGRIIEHTLGLRKFDPNSFFPLQKAKPFPGAVDTMFLDKNLADTLDKIIEKGQFPMHGVVDKATKLFRTSVLAYSPRFTFHVAFGGTFLLGLRINPMTFRFLPEAFKMVRDKTLSDDVMHSITQEGNEDIAYHYMGGRTAAKMATEEWLQNHGIDPRAAKMMTWLKASANLNYRFTRFVGNMQRALAFFDGAAKVDKVGFMDDPITGKRIMNMSSDRAYVEGMKSVDRVMGDLRRMSPFEREWMTRIMPFYGWTKHILKYVMSYPVDHPFRAQILAQLAETNSQNVPSGLATRTQFLFFLGTPDALGNVTALTDRFLDPLRTVPNYASVSGWISGLNPIATAAFAYVDPQIIYGTNTLYPTKSYNQIFGIEQGTASGGPLKAAEQFVPELQSLAMLTGLTKTYRTLKRTDPSAFNKAIFESLNIPFAQVQHINLRQMAAKDEDDRYEQAKAAATNAWQTGTFQSVKTYGEMPYPINTVYNVSPTQLEQIYNDTMATKGLPPEDVLKYQPSPALL